MGNAIKLELGMNPGSRGGFPYDFVVYDSQGRLSALLEAKRRLGTNPSWAREWHEMVVEGMAQPPDAIIMLVAPDRSYAWRPGAAASANPDWTFDSGAW